jgi:hypothetical protein
MPASIATDTPFLPQVPPLQPIPTVLTQASALPAAGIPASKGTTQLQKPENLAPMPPETKLGLNVMPKSPDQLQK